MKEFVNNWKLIILLCLTLGMAPFFPEPHIWGKLQWIIGGANGMGFMDWFDVVLHGFPYILLIRLLVISVVKKRAN
ncbi:hypothetical protein [Maribacter sp. ACAM166]|uniref:hypothetical protein n=1 Tax=Maribacter sp. ACAM166 TaxID=2508996 RepID=UPI0010FE5143|nr:hypothetical protein [Maribacter sp. ACAM166]TLP81032.1 hypothetical protein ES765_06210 [Maribacter sp. ACAM166]